MMSKMLVAAAIALASPQLSLAQATPDAKPAEPAGSAEAAKLPAPKPLYTIYGSLNVNFQVTQAEGATNEAAKVKSRTAVSTDSSYLGVKGVYELPVPAGLQVVYQCETSANVDGIGVSGICNRNSRLGLGGAAFGTLFYGTWDTPYKAMASGTKVDDPFLNTDVYGAGAILSSPGFNYRSGGWSTTSSTATIGFDVRANNSVAYHSPVWGGFSFKAQYSADEFKNASGTQDPTLYSGGLTFDRGPVSVIAAYERHEDGFALVGLNPATSATNPAPLAPVFGASAGNTAGVHSSDSAWRAGAGYQLDWPAGATTVAGMYEQLLLEQSKAPTGAVKKYQRFAWQVALKHRAGNHELRVRFSMADQGKCTLVGGAACSTKDYGATDLAVGYAYYLAKTAQVYLHFAQIQNEKNAQYTFPIGGSPAVAGSTPAGADPMAVGLGLRYGF